MKLDRATLTSFGGEAIDHLVQISMQGFTFPFIPASVSGQGLNAVTDDRLWRPPFRPLISGASQSSAQKP